MRQIAEAYDRCTAVSHQSGCGIGCGGLEGRVRAQRHNQRHINHGSSCLVCHAHPPVVACLPSSLTQLANTFRRSHWLIHFRRASTCGSYVRVTTLVPELSTASKRNTRRTIRYQMLSAHSSIVTGGADCNDVTCNVTRYGLCNWRYANVTANTAPVTLATGPANRGFHDGSRMTLQVLKSGAGR
jgi:hypothetical protein